MLLFYLSDHLGRHFSHRCILGGSILGTLSWEYVWISSSVDEVAAKSQCQNCQFGGWLPAIWTNGNRWARDFWDAISRKNQQVIVIIKVLLWNNLSCSTAYDLSFFQNDLGQYTDPFGLDFGPVYQKISGKLAWVYCWNHALECKSIAVFVLYDGYLPSFFKQGVTD